jgi:hypothetical protein
MGDVAKKDTSSKFEHCMGGNTAGRVTRARNLLLRLALHDAVSRRERRTIYAGTFLGNLSGSVERMVPGERTHNCAKHPLPDWQNVETDYGSLGGSCAGLHIKQ